MMRAQIIGTGSCLPEQTASNHFLSTLVDTSDEWIQSRTGIRQRHIVSAEEENTEAEDFDFDDLELGDDDLGLDDDF